MVIIPGVGFIAIGGDVELSVVALELAGHVLQEKKAGPYGSPGVQRRDACQDLPGKEDLALEGKARSGHLQEPQDFFFRIVIRLSEVTARFAAQRRVIALEAARGFSGFILRRFTHTVPGWTY